MQIGTRELLRSWGQLLRGKTPLLSIEVTRDCPLRCPGCYAYGGGHVGGRASLRATPDYRGDELVERLLVLIEQHDPLHVSLVGGEPLLRHRELSQKAGVEAAAFPLWSSPVGCCRFRLRGWSCRA
jgi:MoaA/NifB/PqqE/SkfB family radical SAM enzyme